MFYNKIKKTLLLANCCGKGRINNLHIFLLESNQHYSTADCVSTTAHPDVLCYILMKISSSVISKGASSICFLSKGKSITVIVLGNYPTQRVGTDKK